MLLKYLKFYNIYKCNVGKELYDKKALYKVWMKSHDFLFVCENNVDEKKWNNGHRNWLRKSK